MGFLDNIFKDDKNKKTTNNSNPLANVFGRQTFHGGGQTLGGSKPGQVLSISLDQPGPLGVRVEKRPNSEGTAIVNQVVAGSQAESAGMQRGDILCFAGSNGQEEIMYDMFLEMAKSTQRPIQLEIRRIATSLDKKQAQTTTTTTTTAGNKSAEAEARRKAVIAAAEAREKAHKAKSKPMKQVTKTTLAREKQQQQEQELLQQDKPVEPLSEESRQAAQAAKQGEAQVAAQLGYNPYETSRATAGQARNATTSVQHGTISSGSAGDHLPSGAGGGSQLPAVAPPRDVTVAANDDEPPSPDFQEAYATMLSTNTPESMKSSCNILKKLIVNATTKGQAPGDDSAKFRKVRLANAKIKAAVVDVPGSVELLLACGFYLEEQEGESVLLYPADCPGPDWLPSALKQLSK